VFDLDASVQMFLRSSKITTWNNSTEKMAAVEMQQSFSSITPLINLPYISIPESSTVCVCVCVSLYAHASSHGLTLINLQHTMEGCPQLNGYYGECVMWPILSEGCVSLSSSSIFTPYYPSPCCHNENDALVSITLMHYYLHVYVYRL